MLSYIVNLNKLNTKPVNVYVEKQTAIEQQITISQFFEVFDFSDEKTGIELT